MCAMLFVALLPFSSYAVVVSVIQRDWELGNASAAALFSAYLAGLAFASLLIVPLTDRFPVERFVVAGVGMLAVSNLLFPVLASGPASAALLRFVAGCGHVTVYFPSIRLVSQRFDRGGRGSAVAAFVGAGYLGTTLSYTITGIFLETTGSWRYAYGWTATVALAAVPLAYGLCRGPSSLKLKAPGLLTLRPLKERPLVLAIAGYALHSAELYLARLWLPLLLGAYLVRQEGDVFEANARAASIAGLMFSTGVVGVFLAGTVSDRVGRTLTAALLFAASGACSFAVGWLLDAPVLVIMSVGVIYGLTTAADSSIYSTAITELSPPALLGSTLAIQSFFGFLAGALAPMAAGYVLDRFSGDGAWTVAFGFNGLLAVLGVAALVALRRRPEAVAMAGGRR